MIAKSIAITLLSVVIFANVAAEWNKFACYDVGFEVGAGTSEKDNYFESCDNADNKKAYLDGIRDGWDSGENPQSELESELEIRDLLTPPERMETVE